MKIIINVDHQSLLVHTRVTQIQPKKQHIVAQY